MIKFLIARGIGFSPGSVKYIVTHGLGIAAAVVAEPGKATLSALAGTATLTATAGTATLTAEPI